MLNINMSTPSSMMSTLKEKFKAIRLDLDLTQEGLATKSGVSLGSLKRFESTGRVSLESLLKLALVLECLDDFNIIANPKAIKVNSIDELIKNESTVKTKKRGKIK